MSVRIANPAAPVAEQAAGWLFELAEGIPDPAVRRQFLKWLKRSPRHIEEFLAIAALEQELSEHSGEIADVISEARREAGKASVPLSGYTRTDAPAPAPARRRRFGWASAAAAAMISVFFALSVDRAPSPVVQETGFGEQRSFALQDGSLVTLDTQSSLSVEFDSSTRRVALLKGQAMFDVVEDDSRPFIVETGDLALSVLGTKFSVYRRPDSVEVAVLEGMVGAVASRSPEERVVVRAGEGAIAVAGGDVQRRQQIDIEKAAAWTERRLIFEDAELAEVVAEFNRYNRVPLVVEDSALAKRTVTTVFHAHDVSALVGFLQLEPGIEVEHGNDAIRIRVQR